MGGTLEIPAHPTITPWRVLNDPKLTGDRVDYGPSSNPIHGVGVRVTG